MIKGVVRCKCGKTYGFETSRDTIACNNCKSVVRAKDYEVKEPVVAEEELVVEKSRSYTIGEIPDMVDCPHCKKSFSLMEKYQVEDKPKEPEGAVKR